MTNQTPEPAQTPVPGETLKERMARLGIEEDTSAGSTVTFVSQKGLDAAKKQAGQSEPAA